MEEFIKEIEERIKHLQEDVNVVSLAKISELTLVNKRLKQLLIQRVSFSEERVEVCDHCGISPKEFAGLCYKCADDLAME